jgi:hypothetical protein
MIKRYVLVVVILGLLIMNVVSCTSGVGGLGVVGHVVPYQDSNFTVKPSSSMTITINMAKGAVFEGYLTVQGGSNDIGFYIKDSHGNKVLDENRVNGKYDFSYTATLGGFHIIYFDNSFSTISKQIYIHYRVR